MSTGLAADEFARALIAGVQVFELDGGEEAAVRLLIANGSWLRRPEIREHVSAVLTPTLTARLNWAAVATEADRVKDSGAVLRLACHLAGHVPGMAEDWSIANMVAELDATTALLASRAFAMAALGPDVVGPL